jgi:hypothetical protein
MEFLKKLWNWLLSKTTIDKQIEIKVTEVKKEVVEVVKPKKGRKSNQLSSGTTKAVQSPSGATKAVQNPSGVTKAVQNPSGVTKAIKTPSGVTTAIEK